MGNSEPLFALGTSCMDVSVPCHDVTFQPGGVRLKTAADGGEHFIPHPGPPLTWGEKREASTDLGELSQRVGASVTPGGGGVNLAAALGVEATFLDTNAPCPSVSAHLEARGIRTVSLGQFAPLCNDIITMRGVADRAILKSPVPSQPRIPPNGSNAPIAAALRTGVLVANSVKNFPLLANMARTAKRFFTALTGATPNQCLYLLKLSELAACNARELCAVAGARGIQSTPDESPSARATIARTMLALREQVPFRNLVVSIGSQGSLLLPSNTRTVLHVIASPSISQREYLLGIARDPLRRNAAGDRFFAALSVAYVRSGGLLHGARTATAAVVSSLSRPVKLTPAQTSVTVIPV